MVDTIEYSPSTTSPGGAMGKVIYLTGAPASGKSSTTRLLRAHKPDLLVWEYGARLTAHLQERSEAIDNQDDLRAQSASIVTPEDIDEVDRALVEYVRKNRQSHNVIIDSHPVTKENFGFRITPFSLDQFKTLSPDEIWVLHVDPQVAIQRINDDAAGRPMVTEEQSRFHSSLQASVAATYGMAIGRTVYLFDSSGDQIELVTSLRRRLS